MRLAEHTVQLKGTAESAWAKLVDWQTIPEWDIFVQSMHFDGPLRQGSEGKFVLANGQSFTLRVTSFDPIKSYVDEFGVLGNRFIFGHSLSELSGGNLELRLTIDAEGWLPTLLKGPLSKDMQTKLPILLERFKEQYESA